MTFAANRHVAATLTNTPVATAVDRARPIIAHGLLRRAPSAIADLLAAVGIVLGVPFAILAVGIPIALCLRFLLWIAGML